MKFIDIARLEVPFLRTQAEFETGAPPRSIAEAQEAIRWADHLLARDDACAAQGNF